MKSVYGRYKKKTYKICAKNLKTIKICQKTIHLNGINMKELSTDDSFDKDFIWDYETNKPIKYLNQTCERTVCNINFSREHK